MTLIHNYFPTTQHLANLSAALENRHRVATGQLFLHFQLGSLVFPSFNAPGANHPAKNVVLITETSDSSGMSQVEL